MKKARIQFSFVFFVNLNLNKGMPYQETMDFVAPFVDPGSPRGKALMDHFRILL